MFQKQTFGAANTGFGSFNAGASTSSPFGGFKLNTGTSAFGAPPAFGANATTQPATGGGLFGTPNTSTGLFGSTPATSTFGTSSGFGFGASTSTGGLFNNSSGGGLFGSTQPNTSFGAKPNTGFGFGNQATTNTTGGIFGSTPSTSTGLFGQQNTTMNSGGLFGGTTAGFGQTQATGTAHVKYNPVVGTDIVVKGGNSQNVNIKHHCITCMKEYEGKSLEELRLEDYVAGRKGSTTGVFSFQQTENKPLFGGSTFGQPATTSAPSLFGGSIGTTPAFGQTTTTIPILRAKAQFSTLYETDTAFDYHICPLSCPEVYSPVCVGVNRGHGSYYKFFTFVNHCAGDLYYCKHWQEFSPPPDEEEMVKSSPLSWSYCAANRYIQFARFTELTSSMGHYGWLAGDYKPTHIMEPHERRPGYG